ncbi:MAG: acyl-CoA dehydrogenase family protein [Burkholderiales bacterium]
MYLERTPEQRMLFETAERFFRSHADDASWPAMGELGLLAAAVAEDHGGLGGRAADIAPVAEAIGTTGAALPYFASVLLPAALLSTVPAPTCQPLLARFLAGSTRIAVAHSERHLEFGSEELATRVDAGRIAGSKRRVWDGCNAETIVASARGPGGMAWYRVEARSHGVEVQSASDAHDWPLATVVFSGAPCEALCSGPLAHDALNRALTLAIVGVLAESLGIMRRLLEATREWLTARKQFGRALWSNQVLQHRFVDMFVAVEESRSMLNLAIHACDAADGREIPDALHAAKAHIATSARHVGQQAVHLHGAMGLTEELRVGPSYRRLEALNAAFGGVDHHTWAYAAASKTSFHSRSQ